MPISFIGSNGSSAINGGNASIDLTAITGLAQNDLVIVAYHYSDNDNVDYDLAMVTTGYAEVADLFANDSLDSNLGVFWKVMGAIVDTTAVTQGFGGGDEGNAAVCMVFRGVDTTTPMDVTPTTVQLTDTGIPDPPSINHNNPSGVWTVVAGGTGHNGGTSSYTAPTNYVDLVHVSRTESTDGIVGMAYYTTPSDPEDPAAFGWSLTDNVGYACCAVTMALRPASAVARAPKSLQLNQAVNRAATY